ncbi:MAG: Hemerythrin HHE cation binding region [Ignavibacteria bacterium]|nr:MAG: Hemerythrin HHE cation binding region [Ignavibacteria bacterium]KAF0160722.1 MAG: Hemerythrin HHE cation binding region [Ignavibacteria bacterium]
MPIIQWKEIFSVNISKIDSQHKKIIDLINELHDKMKEGKGKEKESLSQILNELAVYTANHFKTEEELFYKYKYPNTEAHILEHKKLVDKVLQIKADFESGKVVLTLDVMDFLKDWLSNHISGTDKAYTAFLNAKGVN